MRNLSRRDCGLGESRVDASAMKERLTEGPV